MQTLLLQVARLKNGLMSRWRIWYYRQMGMRIEGKPWLQPIDVPRQYSDITIQDGVALDRGVALLCSDPAAADKILIGEQTYINRNTIIDASLKIHIGEQCMIGPGSYITDHDHGISAEVPPSETPLVSAPTVLEKRCWIGANVTILKGVTIGESSVIGAGSVVTKSIPAFSVAVGSPAKVLRKIEQD